MLPILYSFRRCPFAIRARMALSYARVAVEHREVLLRNKPRAMLLASAKATVPVLVLPDGRVIDESIDVMRWALEQKDPDHWWSDELASDSHELVRQCDFDFKVSLDRYKYADRHPDNPPAFYRGQAEGFLDQLEQKLTSRQYLLADQLTFSDVALFPFVRQFAMVDKPWFDQAPYPNLQTWLQVLLDSVLFTGVMAKYPPWQEALTDE
jgi:glutathione S-transferase